jgi:thiamine-phosphate pyrophosphorylase
MIDFNLYLITDRKQVRGASLYRVIEQALKGGARTVQLREKDLSSRNLYIAACEMRELTARYGARLIINDRVDIVQAVTADGVHLGGESMPVAVARKILGAEKLIGVSCHDQSSALAAQQDGADFITFGPVYHTPSKASYGDPVGLVKLAETTKVLRIPIFALGGISPDNVGEVITCGAHGIALISAIIAADQPGHEAAKLLSLLNSLQQNG